MFIELETEFLMRDEKNAQLPRGVNGELRNGQFTPDEVPSWVHTKLYSLFLVPSHPIPKRNRA